MASEEQVEGKEQLVGTTGGALSLTFGTVCFSMSLQKPIVGDEDVLIYKTERWGVCRGCWRFRALLERAGS